LFEKFPTVLEKLPQVLKGRIFLTHTVYSVNNYNNKCTKKFVVIEEILFEDEAACLFETL